MAHVLLTGGSGFIALHIIKVLLEQGHSVITTVRSQAKADIISQSFSGYSPDKLGFVFVPDVGQLGAFDEAVRSDPPFDAVIHTASPVTYEVKNIQADLINPAINGTTNILQAIKAGAPTVKRVVITGSFVSMLDMSKGLRPGHTYDETDWSPITAEEALANPASGYAASKTFAEKTAWNFQSEESPSFTLSVILPPLVFGPALQRLNNLDSLSESNQFIRSFFNGSMNNEIPAAEYPVFADVRDIALAHVRAMEEPEAGNKRLFVANGHFSNRDIIGIIRKRSAKYRVSLPSEHLPGGELPEDVFSINTQRSVNILGMEYRTLEDCIADTVESFAAVESRDT
ncbi:dihydroflavonol-4-reductase [Colletotrichum paranaense]|uniref:Dihydroflavonol-4-reductase n=1 Tax=Colletotrichum paranaense TaxID=1914294 RepID=A0ABQ9SJN8_9PEZI|nr:dihydroflavonol-4-reductase [Colletotrichum paranaense]KAK1537687.1 dihydroflavonol-4-reductase [Colletotrichum paranaense]